MEIVKLYLDCLLRPVLEKDVKLIHDDEDSRASEREDPDTDFDDANEGNVKEGQNKISKESTSNKNERKQKPSDDMLDLAGPKLWNGAKFWLFFYQIIGHLNWSNQPLYLCILYKMITTIIVFYIIYIHFVKKIIALNIIDENYRNPIFIFISLLAAASSIVQSCISVFTNLFDLCPLFKIITTPKLCFINKEVQHITGTETFKGMFIFYIYNCLLMSMLVCRNLEEFLNQFSVYTFVIDIFALISALYFLVGMTHFDFYIRSTFGFWLIAMKFNLEHRFTFLHKYQRKQRLHEHKISIETNSSSEQNEDILVGDNRPETLSTSALDPRPTSSLSQRRLERQFAKAYKFVTLDEIQKNLNNMDDHLEVWRSIQTSSLVLITLNAFLTNGGLLLLVYQLLANQGNYYHGLLLLLISVNYTIVIFFCYVGDSWISYALSSFVQTVEDEYFLQGGDESIGGLNQLNGRKSSSVLPLDWSRSQDQPEPLEAIVGQSRRISLAKQHQSLLIRKKDVLFCREFLHQFENHLATPWSKLTVKTHLHMLGTFVTLIAAQIIFDHEH